MVGGKLIHNPDFPRVPVQVQELTFPTLPQADTKASFEGHLGRPRHFSPVPEGTSNNPECSTTGSAAQSTLPTSRRRPQRTKYVPDDPAQPTFSQWVDNDKREPRKAKGGRNTLRKPPGLEPTHCAISPKPSAPTSEGPDKERDTVGFLPKLSRILEGRESKSVKRRRASSASSISEYTPSSRRRRPSEDAALGRRSIRQKHGSLQRRVESLANLPNPSLISVLSGLTLQSSTSSGSNSTITQQSYDKNHITKRRPTKERTPLKKENTTTKRKAMETEAPGVFQYMDESLASEQFVNGIVHDPDEYSSTSGSDSGHDDGQSSDGEESHVDSPMTAPASAPPSAASPTTSSRNERLNRGESRSHRFSTDSGISIRDSSPELNHRALANHHMETGTHEKEQEEDEDSEEGDSQDEDDEKAHSDDDQDMDQDPMPHLALHRAAPPRVPSSSSSRHSDVHTRRLRNQEQQLRDHVLQPQPHRGLLFDVEPSPDTHPATPLYEVHAHSGASPVDYYTPAPQAPAWAPPAPAIGYYSPQYVPPAPFPHGIDPGYAMSTQAPMAPPSHPMHPPPSYGNHQTHHYQAQPPGPDLTQTTVVGYELLAGKLSELPRIDTEAREDGTVVPIYRKFEQLNHRVLLHLQDEISELEEELRYTDECIAQCSPRAETGQIRPASRRGDARYGGELHYRRTDLLGRIYLKLGQYNQAMSSFNSMSKSLDPANAEDIQAYRSWLERHAAIEGAEARFLERKNDLLAVSRRRSAPAGSAGGVGPHQRGAIGLWWLPLIAVLPLVAIAMVPNLLGRLFMVTLIGTAEVVVVTTSELVELMTPREWLLCASIYFGSMAVLAGVVHA